MVAKIESGKSIRGILHYNEDKVEKGEAKLIAASGFAGEVGRMSIVQKFKRFQRLIELNGKSKTTAVHISLNFDPSDKLDNAKLQQIASSYMEQIGFGNQPFLVYRHFDAAHPHIHIATTNIDRNGERIDIHGIGYRLSEPARKAIEVDFNLVKAEGRERVQGEKLRKAVYGERPTKHMVSGVVRRVVSEYNFSSFAEFKAVLEQYGVTAYRGAEGTRMFANNGLQYSVLDGNGKPIGVAVKASSIYSRPTLTKLEEVCQKNGLKRSAKKNEVRKKLDRVLANTKGSSEKSFHEALGKVGIIPVFRRGAGNALYGITYIDHRNRSVFNGSELGKGYSAKAISELLVKDISPTNKPLQKDRHQATQQMNFPNQESQPNTPSFLELALARTENEQGIKIPKRKKRKKAKQQEQTLTL